MRPLSLLLVALVATLTVLTGCQEASSPPETDEAMDIPFDEEGELAFLQESDTVVVVQLEVADTDSARERGMMQRDGFPDETSAMLFPFSEERERSFWMSNTPVSLDIFFVSADSQIVSVAKYTTPYSTEQIRSQDPAKYVVETPAGFADNYGLLEGDRVRWRRTD